DPVKTDVANNTASITAQGALRLMGIALLSERKKRRSRRRRREPDTAIGFERGKLRGESSTRHHLIALLFPRCGGRGTPSWLGVRVGVPTRSTVGPRAVYCQRQF